MKKHSFLLILFVAFMAQLHAQSDILTLSEPRTEGGEVRACKAIVLKPGFSFAATAGKSLSLRPDASACSPYVSEPLSAPSNRNYIITVTPTGKTDKVEIADGQITVARGAEAAATIQYFDGLGRLEQTVQRGVTPERADLAQAVGYDGFGREWRQWLPAPIAGGNGNFADNIEAQTRMFYGDNAPFAETEYENSPLNRILKQGAPGAAWQPQTGHAVKTEYLTNTASGSLAVKNYLAASGASWMGLSNNGYYNQGQLFITKTTDEDGKTSYEVKDKQGKIILQKGYDGDSYTDTYFVYDVFDRLRYVLPPLAADATDEAGNYYENNTEIEKYAYVYHYDQRGRNIDKRLPGCEPVYLIYDEADRLVLSQDGNQRAKNEWTVMKYDRFGRPIYTGRLTRNQTRASLAAEIAGMHLVETYQGATGFAGTGYTDTYFVNEITPLTVNYYDNYEFLNLQTAHKPALTYEERAGYDQQFTNAKGLLTGTKTKLLDAPTQEIITAFYYDDKGRTVQTRATNHLGGYEADYAAYGFTGNVLKNEHVHTANGTAVTTVYTYTYDHALRPLETKLSVNGNEPKTLAQNAYNELGQLKTKTTGNRNAANYAYNIRGWLAEQNGGLFKQNLYYNTNAGSYGATYNGNISAMAWQNGTEAQKKYNFYYDGLNRLEGASGQGSYYEYAQYDKHGNILQMERNGLFNKLTGETAEIDYLGYQYYGNRLTKVTDYADNDPLYEGAQDFKDYSEAYRNEEYYYDPNGNLTIDFNKGISIIKYNLLNLPDALQFRQGHTLYYTYDAAGVKRRVKTLTTDETQLVPMGILNPNIQASLVSENVTDYCGNIIYENGQLARILTNEGYIKVPLEGDLGGWYYYLKDHLGNVRIVFNELGEIEEKNSYYPFGMLYGESVGEANNKQPYKYNGKELQTAHGLNLHDYGARHYDAALGRWGTMDPLAEKYYSVSPYAYALNNPARFIDPDGRFVSTISGTIIGGLVGGISAYRNDKDIWAGVSEGAVSGLITGAAVDASVVATIATGGGAAVVIAVGTAAGAAGGAVGAVAGDMAGQVVTSVNNKQTINQAISNVSSENFADKAKTGAIGGAVNGVTGGAVGALGKMATTSTKAIQTTMSENITKTATTLTSQGTSQSVVNSAVNTITKGMGTAGVNTANSMMKVDAVVSTVTSAGTSVMNSLDSKSSTQQPPQQPQKEPKWKLY